MENKKSNRAVGNAFEQELCEMLFGYGFWVKNLKQDNAGQPADVIAVRDRLAYLIDCKDCSHRGFDLRRVEENQELAMGLWEQCGNGAGWFAFRVESEVFMIDSFTIDALKNRQSALSFDEIRHIGQPLREWVSCR